MFFCVLVVGLQSTAVEPEYLGDPACLLTPMLTAPQTRTLSDQSVRYNKRGQPIRFKLPSPPVLADQSGPSRLELTNQSSAVREIRSRLRENWVLKTVHLTRVPVWLRILPHTTLRKASSPHFQRT